MDFWYNKIKCDHCGQVFSSEGIQITIFLYGIFFLIGKDDGYIGTTCPTCLQTISSKLDTQYLDQAVEEFSSIVFIGNSQILEPLRYFSPPTTEPHFNTLLKEYNIITRQSPFTGTGSSADVDQSIYLAESENPDLVENYYRSYTDRLPSITGCFFNVLWIHKEQVENVIKLELVKNVRIFPRYIHKCSLLDLTDRFSWQHCLAEEYYQALQASNKNILTRLEKLEISPREMNIPHPVLCFTISASDKETLAKLQELGISSEYEEKDTKTISILKERGILLDEKAIPNLHIFMVSDKKTLSTLNKIGIFPEEAELSPPDLFNEIIDQNRESQEEDFSLTSDFQKILIDDPAPWDLPSSVGDIIKDAWKKKHPFWNHPIPISFEKLQDLNFISAENDQERRKQSSYVKKYFNKGYAQDYLKEHYLDFIKEYVALLQQPSFAYADLWLLKNDYLARYYDQIETKRCEEADYAIFKEGKAWKIIFKGRRINGLGGKGFLFIQYLVSQPGEIFSTNELAQLDPGSEGYVVAKTDYEDRSSVAKQSGGNNVNNVTDKQTLREYRKRLQELNADRRMAEEEKDQAGIQEIDREFELINKELSKLSWEGSSRKDEKTPEGRNKNSIGKAIERAIKSLKPLDKEAFEHFYSALKHINSYNQCYNPTEKYDWYIKM